MLELVLEFCRLNAGWIGLFFIASSVTALTIASVVSKNRHAWEDDASCMYKD